MAGFTTKALHTAFNKKDIHGALKMPVYDNVAFECDSAEDIALAFQGRSNTHTYTRSSNPTVEHFENQVKNLTGASAVVAVSSGMAAISNLIMAIAGSGSNIVSTQYFFGNTYSLFNSTLKHWGLELRFTDLNCEKSIMECIDKNTVAIFAETISNPQLSVTDFPFLSDIAKKHEIVLIADTTMTPPCLFNARENGVDIEVLSSTKFISGGATSVGGLIIDYGTFDWSVQKKFIESVKTLGDQAFITKLKREIFRNFGACMSPHNAYLQSLGLETLALRAARSCRNTLLVADFLSQHQKVIEVNYPGLASHQQYKLAQKQFPKGSGGLITFDLSSEQQCFKMINKLQLIRRATNFNANQSLIIHPASTIYAEYDKIEKQDPGIRETMIRLAVGIEYFEDIKTDLLRALE